MLIFWELLTRLADLIVSATLLIIMLMSFIYGAELKIGNKFSFKIISIKDIFKRK